MVLNILLAIFLTLWMLHTSVWLTGCISIVFTVLKIWLIWPLYCLLVPVSVEATILTSQQPYWQGSCHSQCLFIPDGLVPIVTEHALSCDMVTCFVAVGKWLWRHQDDHVRYSIRWQTLGKTTQSIAQKKKKCCKEGYITLCILHICV